MAKLVLDDIGSTLTNTAATTINNNNTKIEQALENTLSRDGSTPNQMNADIDLNSNDLLNVAVADVESLVLNGQVVTPSDLSALPPAVMLKHVYDPLNKLTNAFDSLFHDFMNSGVGAVVRSVRDRLRSVIWLEDYGAVGNGVTDDTTAVANAVAQAFTLNKVVKGNGNYLTTSSIPNFHNVKWEGTGTIIRGSDIWRLSPTLVTDVNTVYAAASGGSSSNDGLSPSQPLDTAQHAVDVLAKWAPLEKGTWKIRLAAGQYARIRFPDDGLPSSFPIIVEGPPVSIVAGTNIKFSVQNITGVFQIGETITFSTSGATATVTFIDAPKNVIFATLLSGLPVVGQTMTGGTSGATATMDYQSPTPTAKIKEGATQIAVGILGFYTSLRIRDIEIEDYNGSTSSNGIRVDNRQDLFLENVHLIDCYMGASVFNHCKLDVKGGFAYDCGYLNSTTGGGHAYRGVFHAKFEIGTQNGPTTAGGPAIKGCSSALRAQELSTGHLDFTIVNDNDAGVRLLVNSRLNIDGSVFLRNSGSAAYGTQGSHIDSTANTVWGTGANVNGRNWSGGSGSTASASFIDTYNTGNSANKGVLETTFPNQTINSITNTAIQTFTVSRHALTDTQFSQISVKKLTAKVTGTLNGSTGTFKRLILRTNGTLGGGTPTLISFSAAATGSFTAELSVSFLGPTSQYLSLSGSHPVSAPVTNAFVTEPTTADMIISLEGLVNNAADSLVIQSVTWEQVGF